MPGSSNIRLGGILNSR